MAKIKVISDYRCRDVFYPAGKILEITDEEKRFLMADAPGCFAPVETSGAQKPRDMEKGIEELAPPMAKEVEKPAVDKMVHKAKTK